MPRYTDRKQAGRVLASKLSAYADDPNVLVLALPRGGVPVAFEVAKALNVPLDIFLVRKLGVPGHEELAMGAVATGGVQVLNLDVMAAFGVRQETLEQVLAKETAELNRRENAYRGGRPAPDVRGRTVLLIDDGLATGSTMHAAVAALREQGPQRIITAVPIAAPSVCRELARVVDDIVCAATPEAFYAVGLWYEDFSQTTDEEVHDLLLQAERELPAMPHR